MACSRLHTTTDFEQQIAKEDSSYQRVTIDPGYYSSDMQMKLICGFCNRRFKNPMVLPCFHTYCNDCLCPKNHDDVICFACHYVFGDRSTVYLLPNVAIIICLEALGEDDTTSCSHCLTDSFIVSVCLDCEGFLCSSCSNIISCCQVDGTCGRKITPLEPNRCPFHLRERLLFYCFFCGEPYCRVCMLDKHSGEEHNYEYLDVVDKEIYIELKEKIYENKAPLLISIDFLNNVSEIKNKLTEFYRSVQIEMIACVGWNCDQHEKARTNWSLVIDRLYTKCMSKISDSSSTLSETIKKLKRIHLFFEGYRKFTGIPNRLFFKTSIERFFLNFNPLHTIKNIKNIEEDYVSNTNFVMEEVKKKYCCSVTCGKRPQMSEPTDSLVDEIVEGMRHLHLDEGKTRPTVRERHSEVPQVKCESPVDKEMLVIGTRLLGSLLFLRRTTIRYLTRFGSQGSAHGQFSELNGIAVTESRDLIIPDSNNHRVEVFDSKGRFKYSLDEDPSALPNLVTISKRTRHVIISERAPCREIKVYTQTGLLLRRFGSDVLLHPRAITTDRNGHIIVVESRVKNVVIFDEMGNVKTKFNCYEVDFPISVSANDKKEIFIADNKNHHIKIYNYHGQHLREIGCKGITNFPIAVKVTDTGEVVVADNHDNLKITLFYEDGRLITGFVSKIKQNQCLDFDFIGDDCLAITCLDRQVYIYEYPQWRNRISSNKN